MRASSVTQSVKFVDAWIVHFSPGKARNDQRRLGVVPVEHGFHGARMDSNDITPVVVAWKAVAISQEVMFD